MGDKTGIEWTDATWNPVTGCSKVSQGCKNCYAERVFQRPYPGRDFTDVRTHPERLEQPLHWKKPRRIFVNSMSDLFHEKVSDEFIDTVFAVMAMAPHHTFQVLTKRPERMRDWAKGAFTEKGGLRIAEAGASVFQGMSFLDRNISLAEKAEISNQLEWKELNHVHLGVSVEDQPTSDERIPILLQTPAAVRFVSYEPALGPVDFAAYTGIPRVPWEEKKTAMGFASSKLDWVIAGGESGPHARPSHPDWFRNLRDQCEAAGVPFFFKQHGEWIGRDIQDVACKPRSVGPSQCRWIGVDGSVRRIETGYMESGDELVIRLGKKRSGRMLDGREWNEFPT